MRTAVIWGAWMRLAAAGRPRIGRTALMQTVEDLLLTLRQCNQTELQEQVGETAWDLLLAWAQVDAASVQTQAELVELWQVRQPTVSQTLQPLIEAGRANCDAVTHSSVCNSSCMPSKIRGWRCRGHTRA